MSCIKITHRKTLTKYLRMNCFNNTVFIGTAHSRVLKRVFIGGFLFLFDRFKITIMKKLLLLLTVFMFGCLMSAQVIKTEVISDKGGAILRAYTSNDQVLIHFKAIDNTYFHLSTWITLFSGTPKEYLSYLNDIDEFYKENESGIILKIQGCYISIVNKAIWISEKDGSGFHAFKPSWLSQYKTEFLTWLLNN